MSIDRIPAVVPAPHTRSRADDGHGLSADKGDTLRLAFAGAAGDDVLVADDRGFALRLAGLARHVRDFVPGDVLLLRVLATAPRLELEFLGTSTTPRGGAPAGAGALTSAELAAMRPDQTVAQRISRLLPDAAALAMGWYLRVRGGSGGTRGAPGPALPLLLPAPPGVAPEAAALQAAFERWAVPVFAWGGLPVQLRFVPVSDEDDPHPPRRRAAVALRGELALPGLGPVAVQVVFAEGGQGVRAVHLALVAEREAALDVLRGALPAIHDALAAAGMSLAASSVTRAPVALARPAALTEPQARQLAQLAAAMSPGPFRALAEVVVALLAVALESGPGPACR